MVQPETKNKIISFVNLKGGVGKTTSAVNVATWLAKTAQFNVLLLDNDPQVNCIAFLEGFDPVTGPDKSLWDIWESDDSLDQIVYKTRIPNLDVVVSDVRFSSETRSGVEYDDFLVLKRKIRQLEKAYDYIIIDNHPDLGLLTQNAILASQYIIIPLVFDGLSAKGVSLIQDRLQPIFDENTNIKILGMFGTKFNKRLRTSNDLLPTFKEIWGDLFFKTFIRQCQELTDLTLVQKDIFSYAPRSKGAEDYENLCKEILKRIERHGR